MSTRQQQTESDQAISEIDLWRYERMLAHSIKDVVAEICLMDASIIISYICGNLHANLDDLIRSSAELFFREDTLCYGFDAEVDFEWGKVPAIVLGMEFVHPNATVFFRLVLHGFYVGVAIQRILLSDKSGDSSLDMMSFEKALADARISPAASPLVT